MPSLGGGFYHFLLRIRELLTASSASPARDDDAAIFAVSLHALPSISDSESLF